MTAAQAYLTTCRHMPWQTLAKSFACPGREWMIDFKVGDGRTISKRKGWSPSSSAALLSDIAHPTAIQIGAVYVEDYSTIEAARAAERRLETVHVARTEFRIDVDMTDFVDLRAACGCGQDKTRMCPSCWLSLGHVGRYLVLCLKIAFGLKHVVTVFSGGRGLHVWVADARAQTWSEGMRRNVMSVLMDPPESFPEACLEARQQIASDHLYLDRKVTEQRSHLLRSPFTPHHSSGRIATPVSLFDEGWAAWKTHFDADAPPLIPITERVVNNDPDHVRALLHGVKLWTEAWINSPTT